ncbi:MAG TPA: hypothetical protein VFZ98_12920 [Vicinamibacterales bacterium]
MKKSHRILGVAVALACGAVSSCGRARSKGQEAIASASTTTPDVERAVTMVGCLVAGGTTSQRGVARKSGTPPPLSFTLVNVTPPAPGAAARPDKSYDLVADSDRLVDLQRFTNSRVEVTGMIVGSTGNGVTDVARPSAPVGAPPTDVPRMRVKDVRQLKPTCGAVKKE